VLIGLVQRLCDYVVVGDYQIRPEGNKSAGSSSRAPVALDLDANLDDGRA
jgi:hypothetical protein